MTTVAAAIATNRFGLGARTGEIDQAGHSPKRWLLEQLEGPYVVPAEFKGYPSSLDIRTAHWHRYAQASPELNKTMERAQASGDAKAVKAAAADIQRMLEGYVNWAGENVRAEFAARTRVAATTAKPLHERLVRFWSNHMCVPTVKIPATILVGAYEREAIRPYVTGKFSDMLMASAKNAGMLTLLDNDTSVGPNSKFGKANGMGLNENLGREILELHTMGVDGGYTQADVIALAKAITGWSTSPPVLRAKTTYASALPLPVGKPDGPQAFKFYADWHEPGAFVLLGKAYDQPGVGQGEAMLHDLARRPETARYLAIKLARHFVSDEPSPELVKRLAAVYLANDTNLGEMARALIEAPDAWAQEKRKLKQPEDYVLSAIRALDVEVAPLAPPQPYRFATYRPGRAVREARMLEQAAVGGRGMDEKAPKAGESRAMNATGVGDDMARAARERQVQARAGARMSEPARDGPLRPVALYEDLSAMGQKPFGQPGPQGWYDRTSDWSGAASLVKRIEWAAKLANARSEQVAEPRQMLDQVLGATASSELRSAVDRAATKTQAVSLVLASAEFQRR